MAFLALGLAAGAQAADAQAARDPFWPVGYQPRDTTTPVAVVSKVETNIVEAPPAKQDPFIFVNLQKELEAKIRAQCSISGFMKSGDGRLVAIVNGQIIAIGDRLSVAVDGKTYRFKATAISPTAVRLEPLE